MYFVGLSLLFNIFINDLFPFVSNSYSSNHADDDILCAFVHNLKEIKDTSHFDFELAPKWIKENYTDLIADKCHLMWYGKELENEKFMYKNNIFNNSKEKKYLHYVKNVQIQRFTE